MMMSSLGCGCGIWMTALPEDRHQVFQRGLTGEEEEDLWWPTRCRACRWRQRSTSSSTLSCFALPQNPQNIVGVVVGGKNGKNNRHKKNHLSRSNLNRFGHLTFFGHCVSALAWWPVTKTKYLIPLSILGFFFLFAHQNCCNCGDRSKTAIKPTIRGSCQNLWETYFCTYFVCIVQLR